MNLHSVAIIGGGESGVGAALLAKKKGAKVFLSEYKELQPKYRRELEEHAILFEEGGHSIAVLLEFDILVKSPGIPDNAPVISSWKATGKPVISEIEYGYYFANAPVIGITGSNGKTTTTSLVYHLLISAGVRALVGGNIGKSFARLLAEEEAPEVYVLEISSFQLDGIITFKPDISILLNITPDHLDRYEYKFENYVRSKFRIVKNQTKSDLFIYNGDDPAILAQLQLHTMRCKSLAIRTGQYDTALLSTDSGILFDISNTSLVGKHNRFNAICAIEAVLHFGVPVGAIIPGLQSFVNVPHRLESVAVIRDVHYINDSKATNVDAVFYALEAMDRPVIWIAGGTDKGNDYTPLKELVGSKVRYLICLGVDNRKIKSVFQEVIDKIFESRSAQEAVLLASELANPGDIVLLSPACASFDLFRNYEDRGDQFKKAVKELGVN